MCPVLNKQDTCESFVFLSSTIFNEVNNAKKVFVKKLTIKKLEMKLTEQILAAYPVVTLYLFLNLGMYLMSTKKLKYQN